MTVMWNREAAISTNLKTSKAILKPSRYTLIKSRRIITKGMIVIALSIMIILVATVPSVQATEANKIPKLRIYPEGNSGDPDDDPEGNPDYFYGSSESDPWMDESWIVYVSGGNYISFNLTIENRHKYTANGVYLVIAINDTVFLSNLTMSGGEEGEFTFLPMHFISPTYKRRLSYGGGPGNEPYVQERPYYYSWDKSHSEDDKMEWHGIYPTPFAEYYVGDIPARSNVSLSVHINGTWIQYASENIIKALKVHFDAYGHESTGEDIYTGDFKNPFSKDTTVEVPTFSTYLIPIASAFIIFQVLRKRKDIKK